MKTPSRVLIFVLASAALLPPALQAAGDDPLHGLREGHPRLIATDATWREHVDASRRDAEIAAFRDGLIAAARASLDQAPLEREVIGRRMLHVSRALVQRIVLLSYAWRITGERDFAEQAAREMRAAAAFSDWNPSHFLDTAEATAALALGYDWCFDALPPETRVVIREAIVQKGVRPGMDPDLPHNRWQTQKHNWNQVCFGGLVLGALAIAEDEPDLTRDVLRLARANIHHGLEPYAPDGVYPEGPSYWAYGTTYQVLMIAALRSALDTSWDLERAPGFLPSAGAFVQLIAPSGMFFNFADGGERSGFAPVLEWFARESADPGLAHVNEPPLRAWLRQPGAKPLHNYAPLAALWRQAGASTASPRLPLHWHGDGPNPVAVFRESWADPSSLYLALKGGAAELNHAHMDAGSFVLELDGVRWAVDLGAQEYHSLESKGVDLWNRGQESQRWQVYRLNNHAHNTLTIDGRLHRVDGHAALTTVDARAKHPCALVDLTAVFAPQASQVRRGFALLDGRRVLVQDELTGLAPGATVRWQLLTRAEVHLDGPVATLRQDGRSLRVAVVGSGDTTFVAEPGQPPPDGFNAPNPGVTRLAATFTAPASGALRIAVVLWPEASSTTPPEVRPLASWTAGAPVTSSR